MGIQVSSRISFQQTHDTIWGLSYVCSGLFCKPILCFFWVVVFELLQCQVLIPYFFQVVFSYFYGSANPSIIEVIMLILFQPSCFSSSRSDHFNIREINSMFSQRYPFHMPQVPFVFPALPPLFLQGLRFINQVSFYWWEASPFFSVNVLIRWFSGRY